MTRESFVKGLKGVCQKVGAAISSPSNRQIQMMLLFVGVALLTFGLAKYGFAGGATVDPRDINYNDEQIAGALVAILTYLEGTFGALVMVAAGLGAILSSAFGQYRAALGCLIIAVGAFILRSVMSTFFNVESVGMD